jgi:Lon protease-like protein
MIPIFPLGIVIFPDQPVPLHIFEERYKLMIHRCLDRQHAFGIIYYDGSSLARCGCTAVVAEVINTYDDGRMDILTTGQDRFVIKAIDESEPYLQATVEYFDDGIEEPTDRLNQLTRQATLLLKEYHLLTETDGRSPVEYDAKQLSFLISGNEGFTTTEKQKFLEMTSTAVRLKKSLTALQKVIERLKISASIRKIVGGNGQIRPDIYRKING